MNDRKKVVLIVDDNEVILKALSLKLSASDYKVLTATDGTKALGSVRRQKPDLMLLDLGFPPEVNGVPWDGFRMIQWFRRMDETKSIPVIVITGGDAAKYKEQALAAGAAAFFHKPIDHDELLAAMRTILGSAPVAAEAKREA